METQAWLRGLWEMVKAVLSQKLLTFHLPSSPSLPPNHFFGLSVVITGATSGIGLQTAKQLAMSGAHVVMACRNVNAARDIARVWKEQALDGSVPNVEVMALDLLFLSSVRSFAAKWERRSAPLHVLINNAGVFLMGEPQQFSDDGIEQHMQVNHVAPALLTLLLLPSLIRAPSSRIINVNSVAHHCAVVDPRTWNSRIDEEKFSSMRAYGASKLAHVQPQCDLISYCFFKYKFLGINAIGTKTSPKHCGHIELPSVSYKLSEALMFLKILASKLLEQNKTSIQCIAVHPGIVTTNLVRSFQRKSFWMFDPAQGARSVLFCVKGVADTSMEKGFVYYSCNCKPAKVSPQAADMDSCLGVWQKTLEIYSLHMDYISQVINGTDIDKQKLK